MCLVVRQAFFCVIGIMRFIALCGVIASCVNGFSLTDHAAITRQAVSEYNSCNPTIKVAESDIDTMVHYNELEE